MEVENKCNNENNQKEHSNSIQPEAFLSKAYVLVNKAAETGIGQFAIEKIDTVLSALEKTAKWSLPQTEKTDKSKTPVELERPLPWIPFLATIVALRAVRLSVSFASILIGNDTISASDLVYFLQTRRRKLRAIKYNGLRAIRLKKQSNIDRERRGVVGRLASLFGSVVCRVGYRSSSPAKVAIKTGKPGKSNNKTQKSLLNADKGSQNKVAQQNQHTNDSDDDLTCEQLLEKYVKLSDDEEDFNLSMEASSESSSSEEIDDVDTTQLRKELMELNRKREADELNKSKELIEQIILQRKEEIENEITNKLESQIVERIEQHTQALKAKLDEKIEEIQGAQENSIIENPTSVSINPAKLSPKIGNSSDSETTHNGNADDSKTDKVEKPNADVISYKGKETFLIDEISIKLKLRNENGCGSSKRLMSPGSSSEDLFYSPIGSPEPERNLENHTPVRNIIQQREALDSIESTTSFIEDELKTQLQVRLKQANNNKKPTSIGTPKGNRGNKA